METAKSALYEDVDIIRRSFGIPIYQSFSTVDIISSCSGQYDLYFESFKTVGLCGVAMVGKKRDTIILNLNRDVVERNFDCAHELIHLHKHRDKQESFNCFTSAKLQQDPFIEWEANEGAAQLLVPYQDFIPRFVSYMYTGETALRWAPKLLADHYHVSQQVINLRIKNLSYEIDQFCCGVRIEDVQLLSWNQLNRFGIQPTDYVSKCTFPFSCRSGILSDKHSKNFTY